MFLLSGVSISLFLLPALSLQHSISILCILTCHSYASLLSLFLSQYLNRFPFFLRRSHLYVRELLLLLANPGSLLRLDLSMCSEIYLFCKLP